ncbi:MAG: hypothetical protein ABW075_09025, partial [Aeromicrobium sp.]
QLGLAGSILVLIAVLSAAQELGGGPGAALAGAAVGAGLVGVVLLGVLWLQTPWNLDYARFVLAVVAAGGGTAAVVRLRGVRPLPEPPKRVLAAGVLAPLLVFPLQYLTLPRVSRLLDIPMDSLARHPEAAGGIAGTAVLVLALLLAALCGLWAGSAAVAAALVQVAVATPLLFLVYATAFHRSAALVAVLAGLAAGCAAALTRAREALAAGGSVLTALALLVLVVGTGNDPDKIVRHGVWLPVALLLALTAATVACTAGAAAAAAARRGAVPVALGVPAAALVTGGSAAMRMAEIGERRPESSYLDSVNHLVPSVIALFATAAVLGVLAAAGLHARATSPETAAAGAE